MKLNRTAVALFFMILIPVITLPNVRSSNIIVEAEYDLDERFKQFFYALNDIYAEEINNWFMERLGDLHALTRSPTVGYDLNIAVDPSHVEYNDTIYRLNTHFEAILEEYGMYGALAFTDINHTVKLFVRDADAIANATEVLTIGTDVSDEASILDAWTGRTTNKLGWEDIHFSEITGDYALTMSDAMYYDPTDNDVPDGSYIGTMTLFINMDTIWEKINFKTETGLSDDAEYEIHGLGVTGEMYIVDAVTLKAISPSRYTADASFINVQTINTVGVTKALEQGKYMGDYDDYRGIPIYGVTYYLGGNSNEISGLDTAATTGTDIRTDLDEKCTFGLNWVLLVEIDSAEVQASILGDLEIQIMDQLHAMNDIYAEEINNWLMERLRILHAFTRSPTVGYDLNIAVDPIHVEYNDTMYRLNTHFQAILEEYGVYGALVFSDPNHIVRVFVQDANAIANATEVLILGTDFSAEVSVLDAWDGRTTNKLGWEDIHISEITGDYALQMSDAMYYDPDGPGSTVGSYIGTMTLFINMDTIWEKINFKTEAGLSDDAEYEMHGLGETGEVYIVDAETLKTISPSRYTADSSFINVQTMNTVGVAKALEQGKYMGYYLDYRGAEIYGVTWFFGGNPNAISGLPTAAVTGTDARTDLDDKASFGVNWVLLVEMNAAEIGDIIQKTVTFHTGTLNWNASSYTEESGALIILEDVDLNTNSSTKEKTSITVNSTSDTNGISVLLTETTDNSGKFEGSVRFWKGASNDGNDFLQVLGGDEVTATYIDVLNSNREEEVIMSAVSIVVSETPGITGTQELSTLAVIMLVIIVVKRKRR